MNVSNQTFFRETGLAGFIISLLFFPLNLPPHEPVPQEFALQFWDAQKVKNAGLVVDILGMLVGSKGSNVRLTPPYPFIIIQPSCLGSGNKCNYQVFG